MFLNCSLCPLFHALSICFKKVFIWASCQKQNTDKYALARYGETGESSRHVCLIWWQLWGCGSNEEVNGGGLFFRFSCRNLDPPHPLNHPHLVNPSPKKPSEICRESGFFAAKYCHVWPQLLQSLTAKNDDFRGHDPYWYCWHVFFPINFSLETPARMSHSGFRRNKLVSHAGWSCVIVAS